MREQASEYTLGLNPSFMLPRTWHLSELLIFLFCKVRMIFTILKFIYLFIYSTLAALGLRCCVQVFSSCGEWELLSSCVMWAQQLQNAFSRVQAQ